MVGDDGRDDGPPVAAMSTTFARVQHNWRAGRAAQRPSPSSSPATSWSVPPGACSPHLPS